MDNQQLLADLQRRAKELGCDFTMVLPEGKTCSMCQSFARCKAFLSRRGDEQSCDWSPSRFREDFRADAERWRALTMSTRDLLLAAQAHMQQLERRLKFTEEALQLLMGDAAFDAWRAEIDKRTKQ